MYTNRVLIVGSTGTGKSSIIKYLLESKNIDSSSIEVSSSAIGCTFESSTYDYIVRKGDIDEQIILIDTIGLNETNDGKVSGSKALTKLCDFIYDNKEGFSLIIFVMKKGRITNESRNTYDIFVNMIIDGKIPVILAITSCEDDEPLDTWSNNRDNIIALEKNGFKYKDIICCSFAMSNNKRLDDIYADIRAKSISCIDDAIIKYKIPPQHLYTSHSGMLLLIKKAWNSCCRFLGADNIKFNINEKLKNMLLTLGLDEKSADILITEYGFF